MKLNLNKITLLSADCLEPTQLIKPFQISQHYANFARSILFTDQDFTIDNVETIKIHPLKNSIQYCSFLMKELNQYIDTEFILLIHPDGFILNPKAWTDEYYDYDYIGAKWNKSYPPMPSINRVGNGGFSLRSKKLLNMVATDDHIEVDTPEDGVICLRYYNYLSQKGIKYAPIEVSEKFSMEDGIWTNQFGFHSFKITNIKGWSDAHLLSNK